MTPRIQPRAGRSKFTTINQNYVYSIVITVSKIPHVDNLTSYLDDVMLV